MESHRGVENVQRPTRKVFVMAGHTMASGAGVSPRMRD